MMENYNKDKVEEQTQAFCNMLKKCLADLFKQKRKEQNITIRQLYELSGVSTTVISDFENQEYLPRIEIIMRLVYALNIPLDTLFESVSVLFNVTAQTDNIKSIELSIASLGLKDEISEIISFIKFKKLQKESKLPTSFQENFKYLK